MLNFISLGSGSSGNCYYLYTDKEGLIIDAGVGIRTIKKYFKQYGLNISNTRGVLITHDHADHIKAVGSLSKYFSIPIYATNIVHRGIEHNICVKYKINPASKRYIECGKTFNIGDFLVTTINVPHDSSENIGYKIQYKDITFCIMTDVGMITPNIENLIQQACYLVFEANYDKDMLLSGSYPQILKERIMSKTGHLSNIECGHAIAANATSKLKHVWLCHLSAENNKPELAKNTIEQIIQKNETTKKLNFKIDVLSRKTPSEIQHLF